MVYKTLSLQSYKSWGGAVVARWAHNPKVAGSSPVPATKKRKTPLSAGFFYESKERKTLFCSD